MRCTDGIKISEFEFQRIVEVLRALHPHRVRRVLYQEKERDWFEGITYTACLFLDVDNDQCMILPARPLICRLFGRVKHLPCPLGKVPVDLDARRILQAYGCQPLQTFQQWMAASGCFNFDDLLDDAYEPPCHEIS